MVFTVSNIKPIFSTLPYNTRVLIRHRYNHFCISNITSNDTFITININRMINEIYSSIIFIKNFEDIFIDHDTRLLRVIFNNNGNMLYYNVIDINTSRTNNEGIIILIVDLQS